VLRDAQAGFRSRRHLAKTLAALATSITAKPASYAFGLCGNQLLGSLQGRVKKL
jgi:hypothetical protein